MSKLRFFSLFFAIKREGLQEGPKQQLDIFFFFKLSQTECVFFPHISSFLLTSLILPPFPQFSLCGMGSYNLGYREDFQCH